MRTTRIGVSYGLCRYSPDHPRQAEQVYVESIDEPELIAHPDGGHLTPRTILIRRGRGWSFEPVLELTDAQAIEMARVILEHFGDEASGVAHPDRRFTALALRAQGRSIRKALDEAADKLERLGAPGVG